MATCGSWGGLYHKFVGVSPIIFRTLDSPVVAITHSLSLRLSLSFSLSLSLSFPLSLSTILSRCLSLDPCLSLFPPLTPSPLSLCLSLCLDFVSLFLFCLDWPCLLLLRLRAVPISIHQIVHDFTPPPIQHQHNKQGMGGRRSVAEDASE